MTYPHDAKNQAVNNELGVLIRHVDPKKGRLFWRSFGSTVASSTPSLVWMAPNRVDCYDDRVHCYFSTWITHLKVRHRTKVTVRCNGLKILLFYCSTILWRKMEICRCRDLAGDCRCCS